MTDPKTNRRRFPMNSIQHAVRLYHCVPLSYRDPQEFLHQHGIQVSHETHREWSIKFEPWLVEELRQRELRQDFCWLMDEVCSSVDSIRPWHWRAVNEHGFLLDTLLQRHRDMEAATAKLPRRPDKYDVPDTICTEQLPRYGAAIRET